jgi:hypothetical protein
MRFEDFEAISVQAEGAGISLRWSGSGPVIRFELSASIDTCGSPTLSQTVPRLSCATPTHSHSIVLSDHNALIKQSKFFCAR